MCVDASVLQQNMSCSWFATNGIRHGRELECGCIMKHVCMYIYIYMYVYWWLSIATESHSCLQFPRFVCKVSGHEAFESHAAILPRLSSIPARLSQIALFSLSSPSFCALPGVCLPVHCLTRCLWKVLVACNARFSQIALFLLSSPSFCALPRVCLPVHCLTRCLWKGLVACNERFFLSIVVAIDHSDIRAFVKRLPRFRERLCAIWCVSLRTEYFWKTMLFQILGFFQAPTRSAWISETAHTVDDDDCFYYFQK